MRSMLVILACLFVFLDACYLENNPDITSKDNVEEVKKSDPDVSANNFTIQGKLEFKEIPETQSWEAYDGLEFFIVDNHGLKFPLTESDSITRDQLKDFVDNYIEVEVLPYQPANCPPDSFCGNFPVEKSGKQIRRTIRFKVLSVKKID